MKQYQNARLADTPNAELLQAALHRAQNELGRDVTPKDLAYYIGGEPSQWGRILKGANPASDYKHRLKLIKEYGVKEAIDGLAWKGNCPVSEYSCVHCKRKICYRHSYDKVPYYFQLKTERENRAVAYKAAVAKRVALSKL